MRAGRGSWSVAVVVALLLGMGAPAEPTTHEFFKGKTIRIIVGYAAGGGFDAYSRTLARHLGRFIPGNPTIVVENMPGAGGLIAANHVYKVAKADGLTFGHFGGGLLEGQILGQRGIEFDARKFEYLGAPLRAYPVCAFTKASGITTLEQWTTAKTPPKLGGVASNSSSPDHAIKILKLALGVPAQLVSGYKGTADIRLAAEAGELAGSCWPWTSVRATWRKALEAGEVTIVLQTGPAPHPELANVPLAMNLAKTDEGRKMIQVAIHDASVAFYLWALPPATPKDRVQTLRKALQDTLKDPTFLAEADKAKLDIDPVTAAEIEKVVANLFSLDPALVAKLKELLL
jgi:tripartite-type tricarboxylate transporter receptor subunit TctC